MQAERVPMGPPEYVPYPRSGRLLLALLLLLPILVSLLAGYAFERRNAGNSLFELSNLVGPTAHSLLRHEGLTVCTIDMGTPGNPICFHAGRMPLAPVVVALGARLFGNHVLPVTFYKVILLLLPIEIAILLVWRRRPHSRPRQLLIALLLLVPFGMTPFLADVVNLQVEEGYSYSSLALAVAILFFAMDRAGGRLRGDAEDVKPGGGLLLALLFSLSVDAIYLAKSSMAPATFVLMVMYLFRERRGWLRMLVIALVAAAPVGWALHQHHASGRYSLGTSIDGINLHKGNSIFFAAHYPPPPGSSLDQYDSLLNVGYTFGDEWSFNDFHQHAAVDYARTHLGQTLEGDGRKLFVMLLTVRKLGSSESHGAMLAAETVSLVLLRLLLWSALGLSVYGIVRGRRWRAAGAAFLLLVAACVFPYLLGFAYVRHVSILIYPSVLLLCAVLAGTTRAPVKGGTGLANRPGFSSTSEAVH